ncbi:MAG: hypothetical protein GY788_21880 [bacterium]|nr:hypothetical protein [bacterium]
MSRRPALIGAVTFAAVLVLVGGVLLALRGSTDEPAGVVAPPETSSPPNTGVTSTVADTSGINGNWRLVSGTLDGNQFADATTGGFEMVITPGRIDYPMNCNRAYAELETGEGAFNVGEPVVTAIGCGTLSETSILFDEAFLRLYRIESESPDLVLGGDNAELVFTRPQSPEDLGELPLAAAGQLLSFEVPEGRQRTNQYLIVGWPDGLGRFASHLLTAQTDTSPASWQPWHEATVDPAVVVTGPGPDTVLIPDIISDGDYALCSPFWEPDPFCFTLKVRPPSAPWIVSAGPDGVVLHDANGTSQVISTEPTARAFYVDGRFITQTTNQPDRILVDGTEVPLQNGEDILDVGIVDDRSLALVSGPDGSATLDLDSGDRVVVGPQASSGRLGAAYVTLRTASDSIEARDLDGAELWTRMVVPDAMVHLDGQDLIRIDTFRLLQPDAGSDPYFQYIATELLDPLSGETIDSYEREVAIPDDGHQIGEPCGHTEFHDGRLLCPQPDGRIVTLNVNTDDTRTITDGAMTATYARLGN